MPTIIQAAVVVMAIYLLTLLVLWALSRIGPVSGSVQAVIRQGESTIWFTAVGLVAAFVIIAGIGLVAIHVLAQ